MKYLIDYGFLIPLEMATSDHSDIGDGKCLDLKFRQYATDMGYSQREILEVVREHGTKIKLMEFIGFLFMNCNGKPNRDEASDINSDTAVITTGEKRQ